MRRVSFIQIKPDSVHRVQEHKCELSNKTDSAHRVQEHKGEFSNYCNCFTH